MPPAERAPIREVRSEKPDAEDRIDREKLKAVDLAVGQVDGETTVLRQEPHGDVELGQHLDS